MATLNSAGAQAMLAARAHAATDVTGYGLVGHAFNVARASKVSLALRAADIPLFPDALELSRQGMNSGAAKRGRAHLGAEVDLNAGLEEPLVNLFFDAETSGGLLIFVAPEDAATLERELAARGVPVHAIGECAPRGERAIAIR